MASRGTRLRALFALTLVVAGSMGLWSMGCGTDAVGKDACKRVETARCELAPVCAQRAESPDIETEDDVARCIDFYNDQCLHGLQDTEEAPDDGAIDVCVEAIKAAAGCSGTETIAECDSAPERTSAEFDGEHACEILRHPERLAGCGFLAKPTEGEQGGAGPGGAAGTGGSAGGAGGSGGAGGVTGSGGSTGGAGGT